VTGASAINDVAAGGPLTSIVSLGENGAHVILMAGNGSFNVTGTIFDNANGWLDTNKDNWSAPDVIDVKENASMTIQGNLESYENPPFDWCFGTAENAAAPAGVDPDADPPPAPWNTATCSVNNVTIKYYNWQGGYPQYTTDPIATDPDLPTPTTSDAYCPGQSVTTYSKASQISGGIYKPGIYTYTPAITGDATFENCSQVLGETGEATTYAGLYAFTKGISIRPAAKDTVNGVNVLFYLQSPPATINKIQNVGDGEPVIGDFGNAPCGSNGTTNDNCDSVDSPAESSIDYNQNPVASQGLNDSIEIGGSGTVNLSAPNSGSWLGFLLWQDSPTSAGSGIEANFGMDAMTGDTANINLTGILYNNSDQTGQNLSDETYWGGASSLPFVPGGMLVSGFGIDSSTGETCSSDPGVGCNVTINGLATVDMFQTQGYANMTITGSTFNVPGVQGSAILTQ
jgi:hypothetical protein